MDLFHTFVTIWITVFWNQEVRVVSGIRNFKVAASKSVEKKRTACTFFCWDTFFYEHFFETHVLLKRREMVQNIPKKFQPKIRFFSENVFENKFFAQTSGNCPKRAQKNFQPKFSRDRKNLKNLAKKRHFTHKMAVFSLSFSDFWGPKGPRGGWKIFGLKMPTYYRPFTTYAESAYGSLKNCPSETR